MGTVHRHPPMPVISFGEDAVDSCANMLDLLDGMTVTVYPEGGSFAVYGTFLGYDPENVKMIKMQRTNEHGLEVGNPRMIRAKRIEVH